MNLTQNRSAQLRLHKGLLQKSPQKRCKIGARLQLSILGCLVAIAGLTYAGKAFAAMTLEWVRQLGSSSNFDTPTDVAVDGSSNVYITGHNSPGAPPLGNNAGFYDGFVAKYNNSGTLQWIRKIATSTNDFINGVVTDTSGNVYIAGETKGNTLFAYSNAFVAKYATDGRQLWIRKFGAAVNEPATDIAIDKTGNLFVTGITFGSLAGPNAGSFDVWLAKFNSSGQRLWTRQLGTSGFDESNGVAVDSVGNVYITGNTPGSLGGPNAGSDDAWLAKYNTNGQRLWIRQLGNSEANWSESVAVDSTGNAYITGRTGTGNLGGTGTGLTFIAKYNGSGNRLWVTQYDDDEVESSDIKVDSSNNIWTAGGGGNLVGGSGYGSIDAVFSKLNSNGVLLQSTYLGTSSTESTAAIALNTLGNVYITGTTFGSLGGASAGGTDIFVAKYRP